MSMLIQHFGAPMKERRRGGLLLVGSMAGFLGSAQISVVNQQAHLEAVGERYFTGRDWFPGTDMSPHSAQIS